MIGQYIVWVMVAFVLWLLVRHWPPSPPPVATRESRAFTTVSVPRPPDAPENLDEFVGKYDWRPSVEVPSTIQYGRHY